MGWKVAYIITIARIADTKFNTGVEAISMVETLGGEMICSDQQDRVLEYGDQDTAYGGMMPAT